MGWQLDECVAYDNQLKAAERHMSESEPEVDERGLYPCWSCDNAHELIASEEVAEATRAGLAYCILCTVDSTDYEVHDRAELHTPLECWEGEPPRWIR